MKSWGTWEKHNEEEFGSVHTSMQQPNAPKLESLIVMRIEYLSSLDMGKAGLETNVLWMGGKVENLSDGTWLIPGARTKFHKEGEATEVYWDVLPEATYPPVRTTEKFDQKLWNKDKVVAWRRNHGKVDYGIWWIIYNLEPSN